MASTVDYMAYVCEQVSGVGDLRYKKMFGEYMVYLNDKPLLLVCDNTVFIKQHAAISERMAQAACGVPYAGAREHYILDVEDRALAREVLLALEAVTPVPKPRKKKVKE